MWHYLLCVFILPKPVGHLHGRVVHVAEPLIVFHLDDTELMEIKRDEEKSDIDDKIEKN